jgi:hypothetical protein
MTTTIQLGTSARAGLLCGARAFRLAKSFVVFVKRNLIHYDCEVMHHFAVMMRVRNMHNRSEW